MRVVNVDLLAFESKNVPLPSNSIMIELRSGYTSFKHRAVLLCLDELAVVSCEFKLSLRLEMGWEFIGRTRLNGKYTYGLMRGLVTPRKFGVLMGKTLPVVLGDQYWMYGDTPCAEPDNPKVLTCSVLVYSSMVDSKHDQFQS